MKTFFPKFAIKNYSIYVAIIVIFVYNYVLDQDMNCTCEQEDKLICILYMALPFLILFFIQLWTNNTFKRIWKYTCCCRCEFFLVLMSEIMKAVCVGMLWVSSLLIEGDWAVCCYTYKDHPQLGCKDKGSLTAEERAVIGKLKNTSMVIGLGILASGFLVVAFVLSLGWKKCCETCLGDCKICCLKCCKERCWRCCYENCCSRTCSICYDRKVLYDQMILEEEDAVLTEMLRKAAKEKLSEKVKEKLESEQWGECFNVAEELIKNPTPPGKKNDAPPEQRHHESMPLMDMAGTSH